MTEHVTAAGVNGLVDANIDRLLQPWLEGRSANYVMDPLARYVVATSYWLDEVLQTITANDADRKTQLSKFHRMSRSFDVFEVAAECINDVIDGKVEQNRKPHRRWG